MLHPERLCDRQTRGVGVEIVTPRVASMAVEINAAYAVVTGRRVSRPSEQRGANLARDLVVSENLALL